MSHEKRDLEAGEEFTRLLLKNQKRLQGLILSLVPSGSDADDVLQETCAVMWRKFSEFESGSDFAAWGLRIARFQVMRYYNRRKSERARLSDETTHAVVERLAAPDQSWKVSLRSEALKRCLGHLTPEQLETLQLRYDDQLGVNEIASELSKSVHAIYKRLNRIHRQLYQCVTATLEGEERLA